MWEWLFDGFGELPILQKPTYPIDRGGPSGVRKAKRAAMKRKNKARAKR